MGFSCGILDTVNVALSRLGKDLEKVTDKMEDQEKALQLCEKRLTGIESHNAKINEEIEKLKASSVQSRIPASTSGGARFKVPPFDGTTSWAAYKRQFEAVVRANAWGNEEALTALTLGLRNQALHVLEALSDNVSYGELCEALEARYGDKHLEHVFRAQMRDRVQRVSEGLQQWALEIEKLVRKAYQSSLASFVDGILVQAFVDGIRYIDVRAAVRLGHHKTVQMALAHALEVEAVRMVSWTPKVREVVATVRTEPARRRFKPRCWDYRELGHFRSSCTKNRIQEMVKGGAEAAAQVQRLKEQLAASDQQLQKNMAMARAVSRASIAGLATADANGALELARECDERRAAEANAVVAGERLKRAEDGVTALRVELSESRKDYADLKERFASLEGNCKRITERRCSQHERRGEQLDLSIKELEQLLAAERRDSAALKDNVDKLSSQLSEWKKVDGSLEEQLARTAERLQDKLAATQQVRRELSEHRHRHKIDSIHADMREIQAGERMKTR